jgi:Holliday junction resolvase
MGAMSRRKGGRVEREIVNALQEQGIGAEKIPLSGAMGGSFTGDITVPVQGEDWRAEVKARKDGDGFKTLHDWLYDNRILFLKRNGMRVLVVLSFDDFAALAKLPPEVLP